MIGLAPQSRAAPVVENFIVPIAGFNDFSLNSKSFSSRKLRGVALFHERAIASNAVSTRRSAAFGSVRSCYDASIFRSLRQLRIRIYVSAIATPGMVLLSVPQTVRERPFTGRKQGPPVPFGATNKVLAGRWGMALVRNGKIINQATHNSERAAPIRSKRRRANSDSQLPAKRGYHLPDAKHRLLQRGGDLRNATKSPHFSARLSSWEVRRILRRSSDHQSGAAGPLVTRFERTRYDDLCPITGQKSVESTAKATHNHFLL